jgi:glycosyltransferase involved in cell wall biosynthesis
MDRLVSVVIPSYNGAAFIGEAIRSVFRQSYRPLELIVVDDGSTDGSPAAIRDACRRPPLDGFRFIEQENRGAPAAIMRGLEVASGDLLTILNGDDAYHPDRLADLVPRLAGPRALGFSSLEFIDDAGALLPPSHAWPAWYAKALRETEHCPTVGYALLLHNLSVTSGNFLFTRELYEELGGFSEQRFVHDWDFLIRAVYHTEPVWLRERLISYRIHGSNTTESVRGRLFDEASDALRRYLELCAGGRPPNPLAPCAANWPRYFPEFVARRRPFFAPELPLSAFVASA